MGFIEKRNVGKKMGSFRKALLTLRQPFRAHQRVENSFELPPRVDVMKNELSQCLAVRSAIVAQATTAKFLVDLGSYAAVALEQAMNKSIGIECLHAMSGGERFSDSGFAGGYTAR